MRARKLILAAVLVSAFMAAPGAVAGATTSHAGFWQNKSRSMDCGRRIGHSAFQLLCSAAGVPRPKHGGSVGDPFVVLGKTGKARLVLLSEREFPPGAPSTLSDGTTWSSHGITCSVAAKVTCRNTSGHGFTLGNGGYRAF